MNRKNFFQRLLGWLRPAQKTSPSEIHPSNNKEATAILQKLQLTSEVELTCDEVFVILDEYTEKAMRGEDVARVMPLVKQHLEMCPDCREEYEALERIVQSTSFK